MQLDIPAPYDEAHFLDTESPEIWGSDKTDLMTPEGYQIYTKWIAVNNKHGLTRPGGFLMNWKTLSDLVLPSIKSVLDGYSTKAAKNLCAYENIQSKIKDIQAHIAAGTFPKLIEQSIKIRSKEINGTTIADLKIESMKALTEANLKALETSLTTKKNERIKLIQDLIDDVKKCRQTLSLPTTTELAVFRHSLEYYYFLSKFQDTRISFQLKKEKDQETKRLKADKFQEHKAKEAAAATQAASIKDVQDMIKKALPKNVKGASTNRPKVDKAQEKSPAHSKSKATPKKARKPKHQTDGNPKPPGKGKNAKAQRKRNSKTKSGVSTSNKRQ